MAVDDHVLVVDEHLRVNVVQIPLEALAVELFAECDALADVSEIVFRSRILAVCVEEAFVVVEPDFGQSLVVATHDISAMLARHVVRMAVAIDVTHPTARHKLQRAAAHPRLFIVNSLFNYVKIHCSA